MIIQHRLNSSIIVVNFWGDFYGSEESNSYSDNTYMCPSESKNMHLLVLEVGWLC